MKTLCPPGYHQSGFVGTHAPGHIMYNTCISCTQVHELQQSHCGDNWEGTLFSWLHIYILYNYNLYIIKNTVTLVPRGNFTKETKKFNL